MHRCINHALYRSKLWEQDHCQYPQNANLDGSTLEGTAQGIGRPFGGGGAETQGWGYHATSHLRSRLESQHQSVPGCAEECGDPLVQLGGRWQTLDVAPGLGADPQVQRDPGLASEGVLRLCTLLSLPPPPPTWTRWTTLFVHTSRASPTWPPTTPKPAWSPPSAEYSPRSRRRLWKRNASSSGSVSKRWLSFKIKL